MTSLVSPAEVKVLVKTGLNDSNLQDVIDRVEAEVTERIGAPWSGNSTPAQVVKTMRGEGENLFLPTEIYAVVSIVEDNVTLDSDEYEIWGGGVIQRLPDDAFWGDRIVVTYQPADDRQKRARAIIDLCRIVLEQNVMKFENIGNEYMFSAPDNWEVEFNKVMKRLMFKAI